MASLWPLQDELGRPTDVEIELHAMAMAMAMAMGPALQKVTFAPQAAPGLPTPSPALCPGGYLGRGVREVRLVVRWEGRFL